MIKDKWDDFAFEITERFLDVQEWLSERGPWWAKQIGQVDCDGHTVRVYRPRLTKWLFPAFWRHRLPRLWESRLICRGYATDEGWSAAIRATLSYWQDDWQHYDGFVGCDVLIADEMPEVIMWSRDCGLTWEASGDVEDGDALQISTHDEGLIMAAKR